jgi:uncharacterized protein YndB with AHSA1/START domain
LTFNGSLEVTTTIKVPREKVFDAWLTADRMARFLCAGDTHVAMMEVDPRVGGAFRIVMANAQGSYDHRGRYLEIERPARLRFTWASASTDGTDAEVTVTFEDVEEGTRVTLVQVSLPDAPAVERHERGWLSILAKCQGELESAPSQSVVPP